jgi:UPF0176 protein
MSTGSARFSVATFYVFATLPDHAELRVGVEETCRTNAVTGSILLAEEGVNGTIAGTRSGVEAVVGWCRSDPRLSGLRVRWSEVDHEPFLRLKVRSKAEIVTLGVDGVDTQANTGVHVPPARWNELISDPEVVLIDARNDYEVAIGTFRGAIDPATPAFRGFPEWVARNLDPATRPKIAMFCTGGIRCEKASAYLRQRGFEEVYQLDGGILSYLETVPAEDSVWEGECYVFDRRVTVRHGLEPGNMEVCPNCNNVVDQTGRRNPGYETGVCCGGCHGTLTEERRRRFAERQRQIELADARGERHLGRRPSSNHG